MNAWIIWTEVGPKIFCAFLVAKKGTIGIVYHT